MEQFNSYIETHRERFLAELGSLLRVPSIAAQGLGIAEAVVSVQQRLQTLGAEVRLFDLPNGSPVIYATLGSGPRRLLIYDHYDVQPADPEYLWTTPAFEPTIRDGKLYARGVADNKGNLMLRIQAIEAWLATMGRLPCQIAFVIEGEEEIGSVNLPAFCRDHADLLRADGVLWETGGREYSERPTINCGAKGLQYVELLARGASSDAHSSLAPILPNPAWRLVWALATLKGPDERVQIPGFYDSVRPPNAADMAALETIPHNDDELLAAYGLPAFLGNTRGIERLRRLLFEPTCNICGLVAGYTGQGSKTVLPNEARVKIDFRLVPDMEPDAVIAQLRSHLDAHGFSDIAIVDLHGEHPARSDPTSRLVQALARAAETVYQTPPVIAPTMAGTGPMYELGPALGSAVASGAGCGYPGMQIHAPNEHVRLDDYWLAMRWMGAFLGEFAAE